MKSSVRRLRPKEVTLVADILAQEHDDIEELAKDVIRALNRYRATEQLYVRMVKTSQVTLLYGPYPNPADAAADDESHGVGRAGKHYTVGIAPLHGPYGGNEQE